MLSKEPPPDLVRVLVGYKAFHADGSGVVMIGYLDKDQWFDDYGNELMFVPDDWQPLPEPPK